MDKYCYDHFMQLIESLNLTVFLFIAIEEGNCAVLLSPFNIDLQYYYSIVAIQVSLLGLYGLALLTYIWLILVHFLRLKEGLIMLFFSIKNVVKKLTSFKKYFHKKNQE